MLGAPKPLKNFSYITLLRVIRVYWVHVYAREAIWAGLPIVREAAPKLPKKFLPTRFRRITRSSERFQ